MNRDIHIQKGSDYPLVLEFLGEDNLDYSFSQSDSLSIKFTDFKGSKTEEFDISLYDFENPLTYVIKNEVLEEFTSDPIKFNLVLTKSDISFSILSGLIYRE